MENPITAIFPTLLENLTEGIVFQNPEGTIIYANKAASKILGLTAEQLIGKSSFDASWKAIKQDGNLFPGEEHPAIITLKTGKPQRDIVMGVHKSDNTLCWIKINSTPFLDEKKQVRGVLTSFSDITDLLLANQKIKGIEQYQRAVLSSIKEGFFLIDRQSKILAINDKVKQFQHQYYNASCQEGDDFLKLAIKERIPFIKQKLEAAFKGQKDEYDVKVSLHGKETWYQVSYNPVIGDNNEIDQVCIGISDITHRKEIESHLLLNEKKFKAAVDNLGDNVWEHDFTTGHTFFSEWVNNLKAYGTTDNNDNVTIWWESTHPDDRWLLVEYDKKYKEGLIDHHALEYRIIFKDGSIHWVLDRGALVEKDINGKPLKIIGTHTDITERKMADEEIKASEAKFRAIFNSTFHFMGLMNTEGILIEANQTALNFFRLTKEEVIGTNFVDSRWFSEATRQKAKIALAKAVQGETVNFELELVLLDGRVVVIDFSIRPIIDKNGKVILLIPEGKDITEKLKMEKEIELARLTKQKDILMAGIEGQEKQRKEIARELHDNINQVLATVKIYLQLAGENSDMRERLIKKSYENVSHAIEEVRKLSRTLAPPTLDDCTLIEALQQLVNDMVLSLLFDIHLNHREFDEKLIDNTQKMAVYRIAQEQFTNILKYARASKIELSIKTTSDDLLLCIADNGIGFSAQDKFRGTGLKNIMNRVEALNGIFNIETAPDKGCKLCIQLPLIKKPCI